MTGNATLYQLKSLQNAQGAKDTNTIYAGMQAIALPDAVEVAPSGALVSFPIKFLRGEHLFYNKQGKLVTRTLGDFRIPVVHLASFSRRKQRKDTDMGGGRGSVKELNGHSDWVIDISGLITDEDGHPQGKESFLQVLKAINEFDEMMSAIEVESELLTALGIYRVVIDNINFSQVEGAHDNITFSFQLTSDYEFELERVP